LQKSKILIFTYYWPPSGGSGVQRWVYFCKHLKELGWEPIVVTVNNSQASYSAIDNTLNFLTKDIRVYKTKTREPLKIYSNLISGSSQTGIPKGEVLKTNILSHFAAFIRGNFFIPDARVGWVKYALKKAEEIIKSESIKYIITTGPPHSSHLIGLELKKKYLIKWIADFRDPWSDIFYLKDMYRTKYAQKKDEKLEKQVLEKADSILTTIGESFHKDLISKSNSEQNFFSIPNGYDSELMKKNISRSDSKFHIVFTGLLTRNQSFKSFFNTLDKVITNNSDKKFKLTIAGQISSDTNLYIREKTTNIEFNDLGYISHYEAVNLMKSAHLLLNFGFDSSTNKKMISGKLLEYIATNVPIISIGNPNSYAAKFLSKGSCAKMFLDSDVKNINSFLEEVIEAFIKKKPILNIYPGIQ